MKSVMATRVRIVEHLLPERHWRLHWTAADHEDHGTAAEALRAVRQRDAALVEGGAKAAVTTIEWETATSAGTRVVKALAGKE